ncbi:Ig-like domain-containing protein [Undibacterium sp.]|uniref:Ig-like domain-containing protein n=1 Tax=Undibacterium sp. TaxID=1914977 RepID=UPI0037502835
MTIQSYFSKPSTWLPSWLSSWLSILVVAAISTACGGSGDQGREPILGLPSANLVALNVSPLSSSIQIGGMQQYVATASFADGSSKVVTSESTWTSSTPANASISTSGAAQGLSAGTVTISAKYADKTATASLIVLPVVLQSIAVTPANPSIPMGSQQIFKAIGTYSNGSSADITAISTFSASNPSIASISTSGTAKGLLVGVTPIVASSGGMSGTTNLTVTPAVLQQLALSPLNPSLQVGATQAMVVTATYTDGTTLVVTNSSTFTSGTPTIATVVSSTGIVRAVSTGTSVISANYNGMTVNTTVTVTPALLLSIAVTPANASILIGATQSFIATGTYSDGSTATISSTVAWTSADISKATILSSGVATGLAVGTTTMTASLNGRTGSANLTVTQPTTLLSISVSPPTSSILANNSQAYTATASYSNGSQVDVTNLVSWTSSNTAVATIMQTGIATGLTSGSSTINASYQTKASNAQLTVTTPPTLTSVTVTPASNTVVVGSTKNFTATALYSDNTTVNVSNLATWSSNQGLIATVNQNGLATGVSEGLATINANFNGRTGTAQLTVTPALAIVSIAVSPLNPSATVGATQQFTATATYNDLSTANVSNTVVWSSANPLVATVSNSAPKGLASALSTGVTAISATQGLISGSTNFNVTAALVTGINLGAADTFAVLAGNSITNNSGGLTLVTGDVGSPSQSVDPVQTAGYTNYKSGAILASALADVQVAIADAQSRTCDVNSASGINLGGLTLPPGVYCYAGAITITGTFNMNGPGLYIFRTSSTLNSSANSIVALIGGASASNVFWVPTAPTTLGANSAFIGTVMTTSAAITMGDMATLQNGRVLSASAVTLRNNVISK